MTSRVKKILGAVLIPGLFIFNLSVSAQLPPTKVTDLPGNWHLLDLKASGYFGISLDKAYSFLKGKSNKPVIIATLDSGIDTLQRDLQGKLWTNPREIAGNGRDDDGNGYVDDVHGWNFLGGPQGKSDLSEPSEEVREYFRLKAKYGGAETSANTNQQEYAYWLTVKKQYTDLIAKDKDDQTQLTPMLNVLVVTDALIKKKLNLKNADTFSLGDLQKLEGKNDTLLNSKTIWQLVLQQMPKGANDQSVLKDLNENIAKINNDLNPDLDSRIKITGNDANDNGNHFYGNNILKNNDCSHGTGVAGLIAAVRKNGYGIDGIVDNVKIMAIKVVPNGDEFDKDIANGIRYAVDNEARIINMSFGKNLSPHKKWVDDAIKYAASKSVLLVLAAGNDNQNIDEKPVYPNITFDDGTTVDNLLCVGASAAKPDEKLAGFFSNYGKKTVDVFAPGVQVTSIDKDAEFNTADGTSFAAPIVSGIAGLLLSYYPKLSAAQLKQIIIQCAAPLKGTMVLLPGSKDQKVDFTTLCKSGGIVNAYEAVKIAAKMKPALK